MSAICDDERTPDNAHTRAGKVAWRLAKGQRLRTREIAVMCGIETGSAWKMLNTMATELPITLGDDRRWYDVTCYPPTSTTSRS